MGWPAASKLPAMGWPAASMLPAAAERRAARADIAVSFVVVGKKFLEVSGGTMRLIGLIGNFLLLSVGEGLLLSPHYRRAGQPIAATAGYRCSVPICST